MTFVRGRTGSGRRRGVVFWDDWPGPPQTVDPPEDKQKGAPTREPLRREALRPTKAAKTKHDGDKKLVRPL